MAKQDEVKDEEVFDDGRVVTLVNEEGEEVKFFISAIIEHEGKEYAFMLPTEEMDDVEADEVIIFAVSFDENNPDDAILDPVEDEALLDALYAKYEEMEVEYEDAHSGCDCGCHHDEECDCDDCHCDGDCDCDGDK